MMQDSGASYQLLYLLPTLGLVAYFLWDWYSTEVIRKQIQDLKSGREASDIARMSRFQSVENSAAKALTESAKALSTADFTQTAVNKISDEFGQIKDTLSTHTKKIEQIKTDLDQVKEIKNQLESAISKLDTTTGRFDEVVSTAEKLNLAAKQLESRTKELQLVKSDIDKLNPENIVYKDQLKQQIDEQIAAAQKTIANFLSAQMQGYALLSPEISALQGTPLWIPIRSVVSAAIKYAIQTKDGIGNAESWKEMGIAIKQFSNVAQQQLNNMPADQRTQQSKEIISALLSVMDKIGWIVGSDKALEMSSDYKKLVQELWMKPDAEIPERTDLQGILLLTVLGILAATLGGIYIYQWIKGKPTEYMTLFPYGKRRGTEIEYPISSEI